MNKISKEQTEFIEAMRDFEKIASKFIRYAVDLRADVVRKIVELKKEK